MDKEILLEWYRQMVLIRRFEERSDELYQLEGKIKGFLHLYMGRKQSPSAQLPHVFPTIISSLLTAIMVTPSP